MRLADRFKKEFTNGMEFWTSQDGTLLSIAICFSPHWMETLSEKVRARNPRKRFKPSRIKLRYAFREWPEAGYYYFKGDRGKVWTLGDEKTPFAVYEYELEIPV